MILSAMAGLCYLPKLVVNFAEGRRKLSKATHLESSQYRSGAGAFLIFDLLSLLAQIAIAIVL
jgi:uncharacterized membrane protein